MTTIGEDRVRIKFNPSADGLVDKIKQKSAELIDLRNACRATRAWPRWHRRITRTPPGGR